MSTELPPGAATTMRIAFCGHWAHAGIAEKILMNSRNFGKNCLIARFFAKYSPILPLARLTRFSPHADN